MISSFSAHPKAQNKNAKILMSIFFVVAFLALIVSMLMTRYTWVASMVVLASLTTAILVYTKYVSVDFYYDVITDDVDEPLLVVRQQIGKRTVTLCRVPLADIMTVTKENKEERKSHKREHGVGLYVYSPTLSPSVSYRIFVSNRYERSEVILEGSDDFFAKIKELSQEARRMREIEEQ